jgi:hypothetical protein
MFLGHLEDLKLPFPQIGQITSNVRQVPFVDAARNFAGSGFWHPFFKNKNGFVSSLLPSGVIAPLVLKQMEMAGDEDRLELDALGGAAGRIPATSTAFPHRSALFWAQMQCHWSEQSQSVERIAWVTQFYEILAPCLTGAYSNAPDLAIPNALSQYYGTNLPRLMHVKRQYDPTDFFHYAQSIPPVCL